MSRAPRLVFICTGLGRVNRGFEQYIGGLAQKLHRSGQFPGLELWSGGPWQQGTLRSRVFAHLHRGHWLTRWASAAFVWEQFSFFLSLVPTLLHRPPATIYLGEYRLYCYLFKLRALFQLPYRLCLYTGGQAVPGAQVFDATKDWVHHVNAEYHQQCGHLPANRQTLLPHFMVDDFVYDACQQAAIKQRAAGKKMVLSVGLLDAQVKRMQLLVSALSLLPEKPFPILLGEPSSYTPQLRQQLQRHFGEEGFILTTLPHAQLGNYYRVASLFVLCSPKESFGLAMAEAMHHGLPVLCHDFAEARAVFGNEIHYTDAADPRRLAADIVTLLSSEKRISSDAHRFSWQRLSKDYFELFEKLGGRQSAVGSGSFDWW